MSKVSKDKITAAVKGSTSHSDDIADRDVTTSAMADKDHLVHAAQLMPGQEDIVLAGTGTEDEKYLDELKFAEELVDLTIAEDTNSEYPIDPVALSVNGKQIYVKRGETMPVPRKFVECLCNPTIRVRTKQVKNQLGEDATVLERTRSLQFPFSVTERNGVTQRTKAWLRGLLTRE